MTHKDRIIYSLFVLRMGVERPYRYRPDYSIKITDDNISINENLFKILDCNDTLYFYQKDDHAFITSEPISEDYITINFDNNGISTSDKSTILNLKEYLQVYSKEKEFIHICVESTSEIDCAIFLLI